MLVHLDTSIPTAFIFNLLDFEFGLPAFFSSLVQSPGVDKNAPKAGDTTVAYRILRMRKPADGLPCGRAGPWSIKSGHSSLILTASALRWKKTRLAAVPFTVSLL